MSYQFDSSLGKRLYQLMPEVYRTRDKHLGKSGGVKESAHLARYLDTHGQLLDLIHATLQQQLRDVLPATSQDWLIPYFAQLVAANIVSPDSAGKHQEVMNAVSWRQRKGTLKCAEEIAEAVGQTEAELQEGWQRVAITPRVDIPLRPVESWDSSLSIEGDGDDKPVPFSAIRHPSLPATMVDLRRASRALRAEPSNPASRQSIFNGFPQTWRQANRHGVPCFPGSFDDVSRRTVDFRSPSATHGHFHPKRLLVFAPPPLGLMPQEPTRVKWADRDSPRNAHLFDESLADGVWTIRNRTDLVIEIEDDVTLAFEPEISPGTTAKVALYQIEGINFPGKLEAESGVRLELEKVEADWVDVDTPVFDRPATKLSNCLLRKLSCGGLVDAESTSILGKASVTVIHARNCLLMELDGINISGVLEYTRYPADAALSHDKMVVEDCTTEAPVFFSRQDHLAAKAVFAPGTAQAIYSGASDGGEVGYFHSGRVGRPVLIKKNFSGSHALTIPVDNRVPLQDLIFTGKVVIAGGNLELIRTAVKSLEIRTQTLPAADKAEIPALDARDCLFDLVTVDKALSRFEYCTIMLAAHCKRMQASDCIFAGAITNGDGGEPESGCLRYSTIPRDLVGIQLNIHVGPTDTNTRERPAFIKINHCSLGIKTMLAASFGQPGYAVLNSANDDAIRFGAEDGGEMGVGHHRFYSLKAEALLDKMREFLPIGIEPVLIHDSRLLSVPPEIKITTSGEA